MYSYRLMMLFLAITFISTSFAITPEFESGIKEANNIAPSLQQNAYDKLKSFDPKNAFDHYNANPEQEKYYQGVMQKDTGQFEADGNKDNEVKSAISNSIHERPKFVINSSDPDIQHSQLIQNEADNIVHGVTSQYIDCKQKNICTTQYKNERCEESPQAIYQTCKKKLVIDAIPHETVTHYPLLAKLAVRNHSYAGISINAVDGHIDFIGPRDASFKLDGRLPANVNCHGLQGEITARKGNATLDEIHYPSCGNGNTLSFHISGGHELQLQIDIVSKIVTYEMVDRWVDDCAALSKDTSCKLKSQQCSVPSSTQIINGTPVTRDCWEQTSNYACHAGANEGTCKPLQLKGCEQVSSDCKDKANGQCNLYTQTYRCPIQFCTPSSGIVCGNGQDYCLDGNCTDRSYQQSNDFANAASALSAGVAAGKELDQNPITVFTGHPAECSEKPIGYSNCCTESGWGQDIGLDHCPAAAKNLHEAREKKLAIKVGRYCSGPEPFPCIEHAQVYCVFSSKLAKILQEQGRAGQLHADFGNAEAPDCRGITPEQLQSLDLSKMDFNDYITDLNQNLKAPDLKAIQEKIQQQVQQKQAGLKNG